MFPIYFRNGFGYPWQENGWIGLEKLHYILSNSDYNHTARVTVYFHNETTAYEGYYENFFVSDEANNYMITYSGFYGGVNALEDGFSGTGTNDSINGQPFCTPDVDCGGCADSSNSGWWFNNGCSYVNPAVPIDVLVWPRASEMASVDSLFIDIIADIWLSP